MKWITTIIAILMLAIPAMAEELPDPGITPDSPLYFLDRMFSVFKSPRALANERAAEVAAMAQKGHAKGLQTAMEQYEKAMLKREAQAARDPETAEEVALETSNHLIVLARVRTQVPEQAQQAIDIAMLRSARGRDAAIMKLEQDSPERATIVAQETLQRVMENTPEKAREGLQRALTTRRGPSERMPDVVAADTIQETTRGQPAAITPQIIEPKGPTKEVPGRRY